MEVYVNYPTTTEGWEILNDALAEFNARVVMNAIEKLLMNNMSKRKVLNDLLAEAKRRAI